MLSTSSAASLRSTDSSISSYSDTSADGNFYYRESVEERSTPENSSSSSNGHIDTMDPPIKQNGYHESGNMKNGEVSNVDRFMKTAETAEVHQEASNNVEIVHSHVHEDPETSSLSSDDVDAEFWFPPESEDQVDDVIGSVANCDDDDDDDDGNWATSSSLSGFGEESSGGYKFKEDKIKAMEEVRNGKFMALVSQLIKSVGVDSSENQDENWVDIVTNLSWEAASFVKPDAQEGKAMDPDGYVKVKCIATGSRTQSQLIKGLVFKKHAAHKHMQTKYKNPRLLLIQGALDLSSGGLSSFKSMHQEKDNLKSIIEMIEMYHPNVILVEKSVSRDIQESILAKGITLVFDMKLHRLERVARCIGTPISSSELATGQNLRQCESFHIEKFIEDLAPQDGGKKQSKTLMFLEGAPTRRGCTILLMGADSIELKRIKCVVRCAVVMAHHLMLETSFLLDQSAMFSSISPSEVVDLVLTNQQLTPVTVDEVPLHEESDAVTNLSSASIIPISNGFHETRPNHLISPFDQNSVSFEPYSASTFPGFSLSTSIQKVMNESFPLLPDLQSVQNVSGSDDATENVIQISSDDQPKVKYADENLLNNDQAEKLEFSDTRGNSDSAGEEIQSKDQAHQLEFSDMRDNSDSAEEEIQSKDKISSVLESESILVLMSSRNVSRGSICEQRHFSHIKFYRSFDVPLGKFLRDDILDQKLLCKNCNEPPEAHIYYYAHHNKQLTVRVRKIPANKSLPGGSERKLWMWSRCGQCKLHNGASKTTKRVLISSAAGGLSFGKFLELSFSNNSSFKGSSSCGHSFHKDFLYFFGLGPMVAMFKYSTVSTYSVALPPQMMEFKSAVKGDFLKKDYENVHMNGILMFLDIEKSLKDIGRRYVGVTLNIHGSNKEFSDIMDILEKEKLQFELDVQNAIKNRSEGFAVCNLLRLNRVRLELLLESCLWDRRLHALLSSDLKVIETDPRHGQAQEHHSKEDDDVAVEESSVVDVNFENCDCGVESTCGYKTMLENSSVEKNELSVEEVPIDGQVEGFEDHNPTSLVSDDVVNPNISELSENGSAHHSVDVEELVQHDNSDSSAEMQMEKVAPIATDTESTGSTSNHFLTNKRQLSVSSDRENDKGWIWAPFADIQREYMEDLQRGYLPKLGSFSSYPVESVAKKLITEEGSRLHIPLGMNDYIVSDYEDEFSSIIACALTLLKEESNAPEDLVEDAARGRLLDPKLSGSSNNLTQALSLSAPRWASFGSFETDSIQSPPSLEDSHSSSFDGLDLLDSLVSYGASHPEVSMGLSKHSGKRKYSVICLYASQFRDLRDRCCPSELDYIASLSRCRNWDAKGGKSKSFFAKTLDDRFIIKEIKRTEFDSFMKFAPNYFDYMNQCYELGNQTCLAKILGIYQVVLRAPKNGKESRHDLLVMENLSFGRHIAKQYDLKGALHARFSSSENGSGDVLLDQNFVNDMNVSPLYVSRKSKRHLQRAVYNDTNFLNSINVMDYSLLVGVDTQRQELVCGIIDYLRQYTWDKQLENWVKSSLVVPKNQLPTIVSPKEYKKRFRKFIDTHFLSVPDLWCSQRSSNPCKLCGPADQASVSVPTKAQLDEKHDTASLKSSHGKQNGSSD